ncbi:MAG: hypothetical protein JWP89_1523 [Schlesneria sp.]|nr:hypothetical protein [Schlesneria sp.]
MPPGCKFEPDSVTDDQVHDALPDEYNSVTMTAARKDDGHSLKQCRTPRLLVSVRSHTEAVEALAGGADILDIKEPARGSLGMADAVSIREIAETIREAGAATPLSVALGELIDWIDQTDAVTLPDEVTFAKLGMSGLTDREDWRSLWRVIRKRFDQRRSLPLRWVAVAYADFEIARSPSIDDVATAAIGAGCTGLLIDTFAKTGQSLSDLLSASQLQQLAERCRASGQFLAIAGSLKVTDLPSLCGVHADIVAIRSAACEHHDRKGTISAVKIAQFRESLTQMSHREDRCLQSLQAGT